MTTTNEPSRIIVPVSGGKDSQLCLGLAVDRIGPARVLGVHQLTNFDHSLTYAHMDYMKKRYGVDIINIATEKYGPEPDVVDVMVRGTMIPDRFMRSCTRDLKTTPWFRWLREQPDKDTLHVYLGMRSAESQDRRENYGNLSGDDIYEMGDLGNGCPKSCAKIKVSLPIVGVSTPAVYEALRRRGDKINPLYAKGHKRVGCFPCLLAGKGSVTLVARDPEGRANLERVQDAVQIIHWARGRDYAYFKHDIPAILKAAAFDPFGLHEPVEDDEQTEGGCSWCNS